MRASVAAVVLLLCFSQLCQPAFGSSDTLLQSGPDTCFSCDPCDNDSDCTPQHTCYLSTTTKSGFCKASSYFVDMSWRNAVAPLVVFITATVAAGAGTTGLGAVNVPLLLSILSLSPAEVVVPAQGTLTGASLTAMMMWMTRGHPRDPSRHIISADLLLLVLPAVLIGIMLGLTLHSVFPQWFLFLLMTVVVWTSLYISVNKARADWASDTAALESSEESVEKQSLMDDDIIENSNSGISDSVSRHSSRTTWQSATGDGPAHSASIAKSSKNSDALAARSRVYSWRLAWTVVIFIVIALFNFLRGGERGKPSVVGIGFCSASFWTFTGFTIAILIAIVCYVGYTLTQEHQASVESGVYNPDVDINWTRTHVILIPLMSVVAGFVSSLFGIGVCIVLSPCLLYLKFMPELVAANASMLQLLSALSTLVGFAIANQGLWMHALVLGFVSVFGQVFGQSVVDLWIRKYKRPSITTVAIAVMVAGASILLLTLGAVRLQDDLKSGQHLKWHPVCS